MEVEISTIVEHRVLPYWGWWELVNGHSWEWRTAPYVEGKTFKFPKNAQSLCLCFKRIDDD